MNKKIKLIESSMNELQELIDNCIMYLFDIDEITEDPFGGLQILLNNQSSIIDLLKKFKEKKMDDKELDEKKPKKRFVVVTTDINRRGVFAGYLVSHKKDIVVLTDAHMAVYWSDETRGVLGLANLGPQAGSRITPVVPRLEVDGVTAVIDCTDAAMKLWQVAPWHK